MSHHRIIQSMGLMGVAENDNARAKNIAHVLEGPMLLLAGWIVIDSYLKFSNPDYQYDTFNDWLIWGFFFIETTLLTLNVNHPLSYLRHNWGNVLIVIFSFPVLWTYLPFAGGFRILRILIILTLLAQASETLRLVLARNNLGKTLVISFFFIIMAGTIMSIIDPNVHSAVDGIWWAWVTVTTVGYGDIVPASNAGRLFGALLILMGIGLFTLLTASFASFFMAQEEKELQQEETENIKKLHLIEKRLLLLESKIDTLLTAEQHQQAKQQHDQKSKK